MPHVHIGSASWPHAAGGPVVAIGNFDGVHSGHRAVIARLRERAAALGAPTCVYTFDPAPTAIVAPERHQPRILTLADRVRLLGEAGVDHVVVEPFTAAWASHPAEWFAREALGRRVGARAVIVGADFRFGHGRAGDVAALAGWLPSVPVEGLGMVAEGGAVVSSSRVRRLVADGLVEEAATLLGRPHFLRGTVIGGDRRGRTIGFPTANLLNEVELLPAHGVYAVHARVDGGPHLAGAANIGVRPTVDGTRLSIEIHLLDFDADIYGAELTVELVARIRGEQRFAGLDALVAQIRADVAQVRARLAAG
jgi:riboflavin kinase/FMN adenylyltransferase